MPQNDYIIANQNFPDTRDDINSALQALASNSSGGTAPSTTYANMFWYDTTNNTLKMRNEADSAWLSVAYLDQTAGAFRLFDDTQVVDSGGTQVGLLGGQATAEWEAGTGTIESLVSPADVKAAIGSLSTIEPLGTLTTSSGTTQTLSSLDLTSFTFLKISVNQVGNNSGSNQTLQIEGKQVIGATSGSGTVTGIIDVDLNNGGAFNSSFDTPTGLTTSSTSVSFSWSIGAAFDGGTIKVYGVK